MYDKNKIIVLEYKNVLGFFVYLMFNLFFFLGGRGAAGERVGTSFLLLAT